MKSNVGRIERIVRIIAGLVLFALGATWWQGFYWIAAVVFFTGLIAWCPVWAVLNISTCKLICIVTPSFFIYQRYPTWVNHNNLFGIEAVSV